MDLDDDLGLANISIPQIDFDESALEYLDAPEPPTTVMEALQQRLHKYNGTLEEAKLDENSSKVRRLTRIVKQYENAIKDYNKGKQVEFDCLPTPPGFAPIPIDSTPVRKKSTELKPITNSNQSVNKSIENAPINEDLLLLTDQILKPSNLENAQKPNQTQQSSLESDALKHLEKQSLIETKQKEKTIDKQLVEEKPKPVEKPKEKPVLKRGLSTTASKQLTYLRDRQKLFKDAALESKQKGDIQQAKEYLRMAKGFEPLIEATKSGLPIDATSIPTPPQINNDFVVVSLPDNADNGDNNLEREEIYRRIEMDLQNQIEMCKRNKEYFMQFGDVSTASKFEKFAIDSKKDMDMLIARWRSGDRVPPFKYETRTFSIVICNTEVATNDVSLEVIKAFDLPAKSDIDTYVKIEFPFPKDSPQITKTKTIKNNINPVFNETFRFEIDRKSRQLPRVFKRHPIKLELYSKGGFLRNDVLLGTVLIKLTDLETKCTIYDSFSLMEGRKLVGGKMEARVKIREPLLAKQVEEVKEKWLVFT